MLDLWGGVERASLSSVWLNSALLLIRCGGCGTVTDHPYSSTCDFTHALPVLSRGFGTYARALLGCCQRVAISLGGRLGYDQLHAHNSNQRTPSVIQMQRYIPQAHQFSKTEPKLRNRGYTQKPQHATTPRIEMNNIPKQPRPTPQHPKHYPAPQAPPAKKKKHKVKKNLPPLSKNTPVLKL